MGIDGLKIENSREILFCTSYPTTSMELLFLIRNIITSVRKGRDGIQDRFHPTLSSLTL